MTNIFLLHRLTVFPLKNPSLPRTPRVLKGRASCVPADYLSYSHHTASDTFCFGWHACKASLGLSITLLTVLGVHCEKADTWVKKLSPGVPRVAQASNQSTTMDSRQSSGTLSLSQNLCSNPPTF